MPTDGLVFSITTLRYPTVEPIRLHRLTQFTGGEVVIPKNEKEFRTAKVTISIYDPACEDVLPLERFLFVRYLDKPVFWGPILVPEWDPDNGEVTINAISPAYRLKKHQARIGDLIEEEGSTTVDSNGISRYLACGFNTPGQTARGVPELGIVMGTDTSISNPNHLYSVKRGQEVWAGIQNIVDQQDGPDIELEPQELTQGSYALLHTFDDQTRDRTNEVKWHYGWGLDNLESFKPSPAGDAVVTHAHVLTQDLSRRKTAAAEGPSARFGPYVYWDALAFNTVGTDANQNAALVEFGKSRVLKYGEPPLFFTMQPRATPSSGIMLHYGVDYLIGDIVRIVAKKGFMPVFAFDSEITKVTLKQKDTSTAAVASVEAAPRILTDADIASSEE